MKLKVTIVLEKNYDGYEVEDFDMQEYVDGIVEEKHPNWDNVNVTAIADGQEFKKSYPMPEGSI